MPTLITDQRHARQGAGQVIGMGDTGLDVAHCLFRDDAVPVPTTLAGGLQQEPGSSKTLYFDSTAHRKIRYYRLVDDLFDANGHGSHCGGSAAGSPQVDGPGEHVPLPLSKTENVLGSL